MRVFAAVLVISVVVAPAFADFTAPPQSGPRLAPRSDAGIRLAAAEKKKPAAKPAPAKPAPAPAAAAAAAKPAPKAAAPAPRSANAAVPLGERLAIQFDLAWLGDYNGLINGDFTDKTIAAVKAFQRRNKFKETGTLAPPERTLLATASKAKQEQVGWRMVDDPVTGAQVGIPSKQVPTSSRGRSGTRWTSAQGVIQVETFRIREPGTTLANVFEQEKKVPNRKLEVNLIRDDFFILSGMQVLKKFYVRAQIKDGEVRGLTILYDQATDGIMDTVTVAMSSAFAPFPGTGLSQMGQPARRKVEYATGIVVTPGGHIVTDREAIEGCNIVKIAGYSDASRIADDKAAGLALLRVYGAADLVPAALVHEGVQGADLTLVGIADPQLQGGGAAVTTAAARVNGEAVQPAPQAGFTGAAAVDAQGRVFGMVAVKNAVVANAGAANPPPQAAVVPVQTIRKFLDAQYVTPGTGRGGLDGAKASVVRVICVRQ